MSLPHTFSLHRRKSPNVSPFLEKWRSVCGGQAAMTTSSDIMVCTNEWKQNSKLVYLYMSGCVLLACQVYLTDEGKMVTSLFAFDVKTHFLSSLPKWLWKEKKTCSLKWTAFVLAHYTPAVWALNSLKLETLSGLSHVFPGFTCDWL